MKPASISPPFSVVPNCVKSEALVKPRGIAEQSSGSLSSGSQAPLLAGGVPLPFPMLPLPPVAVLGVVSSVMVPPLTGALSRLSKASCTHLGGVPLPAGRPAVGGWGPTPLMGVEASPGLSLTVLSGPAALVPGSGVAPVILPCRRRIVSSMPRPSSNSFLMLVVSRTVAVIQSWSVSDAGGAGGTQVACGPA